MRTSPLVMSRTEWWILITACLGWMFDTFDQRIFILARSAAMVSLLPNGASLAEQTQAGTWMTSIFIAGWATGGLIFGVYGDKIGRVRTMALTIGIYSLFTGLSALSVGLWDFGFYRFMTGIGIGGEFAAGAALIAESLPGRIRPYALGFVQVVAMVGTLLGTLSSMAIEVTVKYQGVEGWRILMLVGTLPALLLIPLRFHVKESELWLSAREAARDGQVRLGGIRILFGREWRRVSLVGVTLGFAGQLGLWAIGTWTPELMRSVLGTDVRLTAQDLSHIIGTGLILKDVASALGIMAFTWCAQQFGRRPAFAMSFVLSLGAVLLTFGTMQHQSDIYWMMPLLGATVWSVLGGYSLYYPELYPTNLRSSGIGLCYNTARYLTALGILGMGHLLALFAAAGSEIPLRPAAMTFSICYLVGLIALVWAPETKSAPLPEEALRTSN
jgi:MFS family permease